jgi:DNA polymerase-3 subunit alpha
VAGYTWGEVDKFRKAVGKKIPEEMKKQHVMFVEGCQKHGGMSRERAEALWKLFEPFQGYGFNKAHAASYGFIAYITAYLKANFPEIYMSAVLTAESGDVETIGIMIAECKRMGIDVLPPSVNESFSQFSVIPSYAEASEGKPNENKYKIRFGLTTIKNFGQGISSSITAERKQGGEFKNLADFLDRVKDKNLNKKSLESLIKCGAMDEFGERGELLANLDNLLAYHRERINTPDNQSSLFGLMTDTSTVPTLQLVKAPEASQRDKLTWEKELLGLYISGHPLEAYRTKLESMGVNIKKLEEMRENEPAVIAGMIDNIRDVMTKGNERMIFMRIADFTGATEVAIFPRILEEFGQFVQPEGCIAIKGKVSKRKGETSFIAEKIKAL